MYMFGLISLFYIYRSYKQMYEPPKIHVILNLIQNLFITETLYLLSHIFGWMPYTYFSFTNLVMFFVMQDLYFYTVHKYLFHNPRFYSFHKKHHGELQPYAAWYAHFAEHVFLNIGSIYVSWCLFPNHSLLFPIVILQQIYTSVNGHSYNSPHSIHHRDLSKRYGSIYLFDRLFGSF
jgi:sterol desaturase/sphingolipid hydroxylase (fatty acid hydroxylase superfamily)